MSERVGAYIIDSEGNAVPDLNDEAMAARQKKLSNDNPPPVPPIAAFEGKPPPDFGVSAQSNAGDN